MKYKLSSIKLSLVVPVVASITILAPASVYAEHMANSSGGTTTESSQTSQPISNTQIRNTKTGETEPEVNPSHQADTTSDDNGTDTTTSKSSDSSLQSRAAKLLDDKRQNGKQRTTEQRQKACQNRETGIDSRLSTLGTKAQRHLNALNEVFTKVQAYQTTNQLDVSNYDALVADATAKQATATSAVNALSALAGTKIDCTSTDPASTLANVKVAADDARTSLQAYRASLKTLVEALLTAKQATDTTGGTQ